MCIYFADRDDLTYEKQEHVFPAGFGGIAKLPHGYVSDQANELFSPLEGELMHNSILTLPRAIFGPGKRGSHNPKKASKTKICITKNENGKIAFGYMSAKSGYYINTLTKCGNEIIYTVATNQHHAPEQSWTNFMEECKNFDKAKKYVSMLTKDLSPLDWVFGIYESKYYLALGSECTIEEFQKQLNAIICTSKSNALCKKSGHPKFELLTEESDDMGRIYGKTAINVLAHMLGETYIKHPRFTDIKKWVLGESESQKFSQLPRVSEESMPLLPEQSHWCIFQIYNGKLIAMVSFYNSFLRSFEFADSLPQYDGGIYSIPFGMICDWKNNRELTVKEWVLQLCGIE